MKKHPGMVNSLTQNCHLCLWSGITFAFTCRTNFRSQFDCEVLLLLFIQPIYLARLCRILWSTYSSVWDWGQRRQGGGPKMKVASKWIEKWRDGEVFKAAGHAASARMEGCILSVQTPDEGFEANHIRLALDARMSSGSIQPSFSSHTGEKPMERCRCY